MCLSAECFSWTFGQISNNEFDCLYMLFCLNQNTVIMYIEDEQKKLGQKHFKMSQILWELFYRIFANCLKLIINDFHH